MSRVLSEVPGRSSSASYPAKEPGSPDARGAMRIVWGYWIVRFSLIAGVSVLAAMFKPFGLNSAVAAAGGCLVALLILLVELSLKDVEVSGLLGGALGLLLGLLAALLVTAFIFRTNEPQSVKSFFEYSALMGFVYLGIVLGAQKGREIFPWGKFELPREASGTHSAGTSAKLLDTSVLIDGRIADICEAHFLDGPLLVPKFVLKELQDVADSSDTLRRQRGRRGLEVLQRLKKMSGLEMRVLDEDASEFDDVDRKLIELARSMGTKIVTNDYNLNKVASVQGISVLNVNQLANALRPAVLPGEMMRVFILREGKETNQGVAYLDDGTMVVVDGARRQINKTVDITVTSVHQTPAGKMIFGRMEERSEQGGPASRQGVAHFRASELPGMDRGPRPSFPETDSK